jgi:excisionase family DNA binding protein
MSPTESISRGLTTREFATINEVSLVAARRLVYQGKIPSYKVGGSRRIPASYLEDLQRCEATTASDLELAAQKLVANWPKLTPEQAARISELLRPVATNTEAPKPKRASTSRRRSA